MGDFQKRRVYKSHILRRENAFWNISGYPQEAKKNDFLGFPGGSVNNPPASARDMASFPGGSGNPLQYSCLENPMNRERSLAVYCP